MKRNLDLPDDFQMSGIGKLVLAGEAQGLAMASGHVQRSGEAAPQPAAEMAGFEAGYRELREAARRLVRGEDVPPTMGPTGLVNEAYLRLLDGLPAERRGQVDYVFGAALRAMRQILVERARARKALRYGGGWKRVPLDDVLERFGMEPSRFETLHEAIDRLGAFDERRARMVEMRHLLELTDAEIAEYFGISVKTVDNQLSLARGWLRRELTRDEVDDRGR